MKSRINSFITIGLLGMLANNHYTVTTPKSAPSRPIYNLSCWKIGSHKIFAKNEHDALKYAKKRGLWNGKDIPVLVK